MQQVIQGNPSLFSFRCNLIFTIPLYFIKKKLTKFPFQDMEQAARQNFFFGAKLVRGAYMEQERARAEQLGYEDPINPDFEATSASYHRCLAECMRRMHELKTQDMPQKVGIMVASHNADTIRFALTR